MAQILVLFANFFRTLNMHMYMCVCVCVRCVVCELFCFLFGLYFIYYFLLAFLAALIKRIEAAASWLQTALLARCFAWRCIIVKKCRWHILVGLVLSKTWRIRRLCFGFGVAFSFSALFLLLILFCIFIYFLFAHQTQSRNSFGEGNLR